MIACRIFEIFDWIGRRQGENDNSWHFVKGEREKEMERSNGARL